MHFEEQKEPVPEPDEEGEHADEAREQAQQANEEINKYNEAIAKVQSFVKLISPLEDEPPILNYEDFNEKCFIRLMNWRDPPAEPTEGQANPSQQSIEKEKGGLKPTESQGDLKQDSISETASQKETRQVESFVLELLPSKIIMLGPINEQMENSALMVQHTEAVYALRKVIIEKAKTIWKEAKDVNTNHVLGLSSLKQEILDKAFDKQITEKLDWQLGEQYSDQNSSIIFNTFLKENDERLQE